MPLPDLHRVTKAIRTLIEDKASLAFDGVPGSVKTSGASPQDSVSGTDPVVNVYLFHLLENAHYKNQPPRKGSGPVPIQHIPIGLDLHYVVTTRVPDAGTDDLRVEGEHRLLGIVSKVVHDFPIVSDSLFTTPILGEGNHFDLILRPVPLEEAINFWHADETHLARPSLFLEARVVQLEPEEPQILPGIVLTLGAFVLPGPGPRLSGSQSQLAFVPPSQSVRKVTADPARVALFEDGQDPWLTAPDAAAQLLILQNNRVELQGTGFGASDRLLELRRVGSAPVRVDLERDPAGVVNAEWSFEITSSSIRFGFFTSVTDASGVDVPLLPGIYTARVLLEEEPRARVSNQLAFAVVPQIRGITALGGDLFAVVVMGAYLTDATLELELVVGDQIFELVALADLDSSGEFAVFDASTLRFRRPTQPGDTFPLPVNVIINGAAATPAWLEGP
jgi:hypothetical protein